jgi:hypothetical protein
VLIVGKAELKKKKARPNDNGIGIEEIGHGERGRRGTLGSLWSEAGRGRPNAAPTTRCWRAKEDRAEVAARFATVQVYNLKMKQRGIGRHNE